MRFSNAVVMAALLLLSGCGDDGTPPMTGPSAGTPSTTPSGTWVRVANLSSDLNGAELLLDGTTVRAKFGYPGITRYREVGAGSHTVRFVPQSKSPIDPRTVQLDLSFGISGGEAVTVVAAGLVDTRTLQIAVMHDEIGTSGGGVRVRLVNAMSDFPAPLDLWLDSETPLVQRVAFLEDRGYRSANPGNYPLEVRRTGTVEPLLPVVPFGLAGNATYTLFAFGTLRKGDLDLRFLLDSSLGSPALRR